MGGYYRSALIGGSLKPSASPPCCKIGPQIQWGAKRAADYLLFVATCVSFLIIIKRPATICSSCAVSSLKIRSSTSDKLVERTNQKSKILSAFAERRGKGKEEEKAKVKAVRKWEKYRRSSLLSSADAFRAKGEKRKRRRRQRQIPRTRIESRLNRTGCSLTVREPS